MTTTPEQMREAAMDVVEDYCSDMPDLAGHGHSVGLKDAIRAIPIAPQPVAVTVKPTDAQINSACLSYRHDFGLMDKRDQDNLRFNANEWFLAWQKEARILSALPIHPADPLSDPRVKALVEALRCYEDHLCEGFCEDMPDKSLTNSAMENDCGGCKARAALRVIGGEA